MNKAFFAFVLMYFLCFSCTTENDDLNNLKAFAAVYGYVKYFHPSDEASELDWNQFAAYGAKEVLKCKDRSELTETLEDLFKPIAPGIIFSKEKMDYDLAIITPENLKSYEPTYWQHLGVSKDMNYNYNVYKSVRVNGYFKEMNQNYELVRKQGDTIYAEHPEFGEIIQKKISKHLYCHIPLNLYRNQQGTYPKSETFVSFKNSLDSLEFGTDNLYLRLGNTINTYNVFQHFFPYFKEVNVNWSKEFEKALSRSFSDSSLVDHYVTLQKFTAALNDGHVWVTGVETGEYQPPINWEWIEEKLVITQIFDETLDLKVGDIVTEINGIPTEAYLKEIKSTISAGTEGWSNYIAQLKSMLGKKDTELSIKVNNDLFVLNRDGKYIDGVSNIGIQKYNYKILENNIFYLNLTKIPMDTITKLLPKLEEAKGIICDLRGYPAGNHEWIAHLLKEKDTSRAWMKIPKIIYPDQNMMLGYEDYGWEIDPKEPYLGDKKLVFITDGRAISYAESYMSFIEGYNLATIIGQPTAGTNGNMNSFKLLGDINISWTGMKVVKHDGSQHHAIGVLPDIYITKSIDGIKSGKDEFLEKAMEVILE